MGLATALAVTLSSGPAAAKQVLLQPAGSSGPAPFTTSPTKAPPPAAASAGSSSVSPSATAANGTKVVSGSSEGLYGGTQNQASCDVNQLSDFLTTHPAQGRAWAGVEGIAQTDIPAYVHSLTPVILRADTRVTNHGFSNGQATTFQSVLQAGTAVLVDNHGVPRARCSCGNPLLPPAVTSSEQFTGTQWPTFRTQNVVVVQPAEVVVTVIVLYDPRTGQYFGRPTGGDGQGDHQVPPPPIGPASPTTTAPTSPCPSPTVGSPTAPSPTAPCSSTPTSTSTSTSPSGSGTTPTSSSPSTSSSTGSAPSTSSSPSSAPTSTPTGS